MLLMCLLFSVTKISAKKVSKLMNEPESRAKQKQKNMRKTKIKVNRDIFNRGNLFAVMKRVLFYLIDRQQTNTSI